jgi:hypothetical protein
MTLDVNWTAVLKYAKATWVVIGPLVGVLIGVFLGRSWDRKKWLNDHRALECRELLKAMSETVSLRFETARAAAENQFREAEIQATATAAYNESLRVLQDRVFTAKDVEELQLRERWVQIVRDHVNSSDHQAFQSAYEEIKQTLVDLAVRGL